MYVKQGVILFTLVFALCLFGVTAAGADLDGSLQDSPTGDEGVADVQTEFSAAETEGAENDSQADSELLPDSSTDQAECTPIEGEITEGQYRAYVLAFLLFFTVIIVCYFAYKFFAMFF